VKVYLTIADCLHDDLSGLICTTIWKLLISLMLPFPPDGLMSAESSVFLET
jgi:hypothetical protein